MTNLKLKPKSRVSSVFKGPPTCEDELEAEIAVTTFRSNFKRFLRLTFKRPPILENQLEAEISSIELQDCQVANEKKQPKGHAKEAENDFKQTSVPGSSAAQEASR